MQMPQATVYRLDPTLIEAEQRRIQTTQLPKILITNIIFMAIVLIVTLRNEPSATVIYLELGFMAILVSWMVFNSVRRLRKCVEETFATYELTIDESGIAAHGKTLQPTRIEFTEIVRLEEVEGFWLAVIGKSAKQRIGIPRQLIGYEEVVQKLTAYRPVQKKNYPWYKIYAVVPFLVTYTAALWAPIPIVVAACCVAMWIFLGWALFYIQRSPLFTLRTKRIMWLAVLPMFSVFPRFFWAIEQIRK